MKATYESPWLRPSLLDRLTDQEPERRRERERMEAQQVDDAQLRQLVRRDLTWLFNTTHLEASLDFSELPEVRRSILNYGIPDLIGRSVVGVASEMLKRQIRSALACYEPRLIEESVDIQVTRNDTANRKPMLFIEISGSLRTVPMPMAIRMRAEVDLDSGHVAIGGDDLFKERVE